jgi:pyruvate/2-oxoglutarate dehydrogenase complex dihydrolipoamide acyltransferase (E2) component
MQRRLAGTLGVTSVGMFGRGPARAVALQVHTLDVVLGATDVRPCDVEGRIESRSMLAVTLMFDHDVVDGAPAARFASRLRELVESADLLLEAADRG